MSTTTTTLLTPEYFTLLSEKLDAKKDYSIETTLPGLKARIRAYESYLPAFATDEGLQFEQNGFETPEAFLLKMYDLLGTSELEYEHSLVFEFPILPPPHLKGFVNFTYLSFIVFYTAKGLVFLYNDNVFPFFDLVKTFSTARRLEQLDAELQSSATQQLETCFYAVLLKAKVPIPAHIPVPVHIQEGATTKNSQELIAELLKLLFRNSLSQEDYDELLAELILVSKSPKKYLKNHPEFEYLESNEVFGAVLREYLPSGLSDWKFDSEDLEMHITHLIGEPFALNLPGKDIYSRDLFPFAEQQLAEKGLTLLNYDTQGDSYEFLVVNQEDSNRILWLCQKFQVPIDRLG